MKLERIKKLMDCVILLQELRNEYHAPGSGWILLQSARSNVITLHHLESETTIDEEALGVID